MIGRSISVSYMMRIISVITFLWQPLHGREPSPPIWEVSYTKTIPLVDGIIDPTWDLAKPLTIFIREAIGADNPTEVRLRALYTDDMLFLLAQWLDSTKSDMRDPYIWNDEKQEYDRPSKPDDQFAIEFPLSGHFDINMLSVAKEYVADVWHWKAGRGNPIGWVDDKRHIISQASIPNSRLYSMGGHAKVYIARLPDKGDASYFVKPKPTTFEGPTVNAFVHQRPSRSMADVRGKGLHDGTAWTLEMSRKFNTGNDDDTVIESTRDNICAIAVLNDELYWNHSVSSEIILRFMKR